MYGCIYYIYKHVYMYNFEFSLYMLSFNKNTSIEKKLADVDLQLSFVPAFKYILRRDLKEEKMKLLSLLEKSTKGKEKADSPSNALTLYNPIDICKNYPNEHDSRQSYRRDKENMPRLQIREKQQQLRKIVSEIKHLKDVLLILVTETDQSSDEELNKHLEEAMQIPG